MSDVLLSVCIPTYNRAIQLRQTLESIVSQEHFIQTTDVEVVISDNCSTDETQWVGEFYQAKFPGKVRYFRNPENIGGDANFELVLSRGQGHLLKLHNDQFLVRNGVLAEVVKIVNFVKLEKPILFFLNGNNHRGHSLEVCNGLDEFLSKVSYYCTWIGGFSIWKEDFQRLEDFSRCVKLKLVQVDVLMRLMRSGRRAVVFHDPYFVGISTEKKYGYNIAEVFGKNYISILRESLRLGFLSKAVFDLEKKIILLNHILPHYFNLENNFDKNGFFCFMGDYFEEEYFLPEVEKFLIEKLDNSSRSSSSSSSIEMRWRLLNGHNQTTLKATGAVDLDKIKVGKKTYGELSVSFFGVKKGEEKLTVGNFVSIASRVSFILGGNHGYKSLSTFPFKAKYLHEFESESKGETVVKDDVWIGSGATILSGVVIGQGAVVAAGSMVTKSVPPYAVVAGNPAKIVKYRFSEKIIKKLISVDLSLLADEVILDGMESLYREITEENIDDLLLKLKLIEK